MTGPGSQGAESLRLASDSDVVLARRLVRERAVGIGLDIVAQTKIVTAASELARNTVIYGGGGRMTVDVVHEEVDLRRTGLRLEFTDQGPGIVDIDRAMTGGWSSGTGLGLGLPGSQRLVHEFELTSVIGHGTRVVVVIWARNPSGTR